MADRLGIQTEFYQLVQAVIYHADGLWGEATFDLFLKELPPEHGYAILAGLEPAIDGILKMSISQAEIDWLKAHPAFQKTSDYFFETLANFKFTGSIDAIPEGTPVFTGMPLVRVTAPLQQAGLVETRLIQIISQATAVATRTRRMVNSAAGRPIFDFGSRLCSGPESAWGETRAAWIGGSSATTNALAAMTLDIPSVGVMSESMLAAYNDNATAYEVFQHHFPSLCIVNLPDRDLEDGVNRLQSIKNNLHAIRLDHQDLDRASRILKNRLESHGMEHVQILGSGSLDEGKIKSLTDKDAPIDMFGVGGGITRGGSARLSYRIAELFRGPRAEPVNSHWSSIWPGRKQVLRFPHQDLICLEEEAHYIGGALARPLLVPWVRHGERVAAKESLKTIRQRCVQELEALPQAIRYNIGFEHRLVIPSDRLASLSL